MQKQQLASHHDIKALTNAHTSEDKRNMITSIVRSDLIEDNDLPVRVR
jgi:hypothetical protein